MTYYRHGGRLRWYTVGSYGNIGISDAREAVRKIRAKAALGEDPQGEKMASREGETFKEVAERFIEEYAKKHNKAWSQKQRYLDAELIPAWGGRKAKDISREDVRAVFRKVSDRAPISANGMLAVASKLFVWAVEQEIVDDNPCRFVKPNPKPERDRVLNDDELKKVWAAFDTLGLVAGSLLKLKLLTAQRDAELRGMRWEEIDGHWWTIPAERSKNAKSHRVYLSDAAVDNLKELSPSDTLPKEGFVFPSRSKKGHPIGPQLQDVAKVRELAGINDLRGHDLRRTAASMMTGMGIHRLTVSKILNHAEGGVTKVYDRHGYDAEKRHAMEAWAGRLMALVADAGGRENVIKISHKTRQS